MELLNATKMIAGYTMGLKPDGRELLVVVVKGTFAIPRPGEEAQLAPEQVGLVMADEFTGEPGFSATRYECDFAPAKPRCDVLLNCSAYAPEGKPVSKVQVGMRVGELTKTFRVVGNRFWRKGILGISATNPEPFVKMLISYDNAFGGMDNSHKDKKQHAALVQNPVGRGFHVNHAKEAIHGKPLPNTEELDHPIKNPKGKYRPMSFGPIGRGWKPRLTFAGTYDQNWIDNVFPFLPEDFQDQYYQSAPTHQQVEQLKGGEEVVLLNLTPQGRTEFKLPTIDLPVEFTNARYERNQQQATLDTLLIEPDLAQFTLSWRVSHPLKRNMKEMRQCVIGRMSRAWYRARDTGKAYYPSLGALIAARNGAEEVEV